MEINLNFHKNSETTANVSLDRPRKNEKDYFLTFLYGLKKGVGIHFMILDVGTYLLKS